MKLHLKDHLGGFNKNLKNTSFDLVDKSSKISVLSQYIVDDCIKNNYTNIEFVFDFDFYKKLFAQFFDYKIHPDVDFKNFVCSFNGTEHVGRQLLTSILGNQNYFNSEYSSKNFSYNNDQVTNQLNSLDLSDSEIQVYSKFFLNKDEFNNSIYSFGHVQYQHDKNIYNLEKKLTQSFLHIVSETLATSYYPFVTEKFLYSIVTRGLFLSYAQPGWHEHIEKCYGFKLYDKIFDYSFDAIKNPVKRLVRLMEMISKFSQLSVTDWRDLYLVEQDTIEYNHNHYFSKDYLKHLAQFE